LSAAKRLDTLSAIETSRGPLEEKPAAAKAMRDALLAELSNDLDLIVEETGHRPTVRPSGQGDRRGGRACLPPSTL